MTSPGWAVAGLPRWSLLISLPICLSLLITPLTAPAPGPGPVSGGLAAITAAAIFVAVVLTRYHRRPGTDRLAHLLLAGLAGLALATTLAWSSRWSSLFALLAIGTGMVVLNRFGPGLILVIAGAALTSELIAGPDPGHHPDPVATGVSVLLTGLGTYVLHQLFATIAELRCTREELARVAVSAERDRFARDLHDLLGHTLSVIVVKAEAVRRLAPKDSAAAVVHATDIETIGREALTDVRRAAAGYRGAGLDRELTRARATLEAAGVRPVLPDPAAASSWSDDTDVLLGWAVREGVTNVVRHARATHCTIGLRRTAHGVRLTVEDDGPGATADPPPGSGTGSDSGSGSGSGLPGLAERVAAAGGTVEARPTDRGFLITVDLPESRSA